MRLPIIKRLIIAHLYILNSVGDHVQQLKLIINELFDAGHPLFDKMQVTTILNSLTLSWEHIVTSLTHSGNEVTITTFHVMLVH